MAILVIFGLDWYGLVWFGFVWYGMWVLSKHTTMQNFKVLA